MTEQIMTDRERLHRVADYARGILSMAEKFGDRRLFIVDHLIETGAYHILEVERGRPRAILRYVRFAFKAWAMNVRIGWEFRWRYWWYRLSGYDHGSAVERTCDVIEEKYT